MSAVLKHCCLVWKTNSPADWRRNQILFALFHLKYIIINTHSFSLFLVSESQYKFISFDFVLHFHPALIFCRSCQTKFHTNRLTSSYFILDFGHVIIFVNRFRSVWEAAFSSRGTFRVCGKWEETKRGVFFKVCVYPYAGRRRFAQGIPSSLPEQQSPVLPVLLCLLGCSELNYIGVIPLSFLFWSLICLNSLF